MSDKFSELPIVRRKNAGAADGGQQSIIITRLSQLCYILVCLHIFFFNYHIALTPTNEYKELFWEDSLAQNLTAAVFLLAGVMLFTTALAERRFFSRCVYILSGVALAFFAGEEISWGQRIIGFDTPAFLVDLNNQGEFNIHNLQVVEANFFRPIKLREIFHALSMIACVAFFCRKDRLVGILAPPILLTLAFLIITSYNFGREALDFSEGFLRLVLTWHRGLILFLLLFALFSRSAMLFITTAASLSIALVTAYLVHHHYEDGVFTNLWVADFPVGGE